MDIKIINERKKFFEDSLKKDISFTEKVGEENDFSEAEKIRTKIIKQFIWILESGENVITPGDIEDILSINKELNNFCNNIITLAKNPHQPNFINTRIATLDNLRKNLLIWEKKIRPIKNEIKISFLEKESHKIDSSKYIKIYEELLEKLREQEDHADKILDKMKQTSMKVAIEKKKITFSNQKDEHKKYSKYWLLSVIGSIVLLLGAIGGVVFLNQDSCINSTNSWAQFINCTKSSNGWIQYINRFLILSVPFISLKISLSKYNTERNLKIIYEHRESVLNQFSLFGEDLVGDSKNEFLLELSKSLFNDPHTGYIAHSEQKDLSMNPVMNIVDRVFKNPTSSRS